MINKIALFNIPQIIDSNIIGGDVVIDGLNLCNRKTERKSVLSYAVTENLINPILENSAISALITSRKIAEQIIVLLSERRHITFVISDEPEEIFYNIHSYLINKTDFYKRDKEVKKVGQNCKIHENAIICSDTEIGDNVIIGSNSIVREGSIIGNNVYIGSNSIIGSEGFQIIEIGGLRKPIKHVGGTLIEENTYIGDNSTICKSLFEGYTTIKEFSNIDNLVHISHNCFVGRNSTITAGVVLCGSSVVKSFAWIGMNTTILNSVVVGQNTLIGIGSVVTRDVPDNKKAYGNPAKIYEK